ncbi:hypothetical protein ScPMuIL_016536 [Solemya velum]
MLFCQQIKSKVPSTLTREEYESQTIKDLEHELKKCRGDLKSDEEIFAEKTREVNLLTEEIESMNQLLAEQEDQLTKEKNLKKLQEQQLLEQQMKIEELQKAFRTRLLSNSTSIEEEAVTASAPPHTGQRPKSVPIQLHRTVTSGHSYLRPISRNIKTSPALLTLDRVMKSFRARSQLLISRLEDHDEVLHQNFSEESSGSSDSCRNVVGPHIPIQDQDGISIKIVYNFVLLFFFGTIGFQNKSLSNSEDLMNSTLLQSMEGIQVNTDVRKRIKNTQLKMVAANQKMRDLAINIRLKEQLIRELVKTGKGADLLNKQNADKIKALEKERELVKNELTSTQQILQDLSARGHQETADKDKLQSEYKKKIEMAKAKISALHKKQKETEKMASFSVQNNKKVATCNRATTNIKRHMNSLFHKDMSASERFKYLELAIKQRTPQASEQKKSDNARRLQRVCPNFHQFIIKERKMYDYELGHIGNMDETPMTFDIPSNSTVNRRGEKNFHFQDLRKREEIVMKKEMMLAQKSELEIRKLRSSQIINKSLVTLSSKLQTVERRIEDKSKEILQASQERLGQTKEEMVKLRMSREKLQSQRSTLEDRIQKGSLLSEEEERRLIELDEAIDALDAAIEYRTDMIRSRQVELRQFKNMAHSEDSLMNKLNTLTSSETKSLLSKYFEKVMSLRENERKMNLHSGEMEVKVDEQERLIRELENALQRTGVETDRRLTKLQREYEQKIQLLVRQLADNGDTDAGISVSASEIKIQQLEKDLYYYKKTSRDLKKKLKDLVTSGALNLQGDELNLPSSVQSSVADPEPVLPNIHTNSQRERDPVPHAPNTDPPYGSRPNSARSASYSARITPVKISRKDLRIMSEEEVLIRRSNMKHSVTSPPPLKDSLDVGRSNADSPNPWG